MRLAPNGWQLLMLRYYQPRASIRANRRPASGASAGPWKKFSAFVIARSNSFGKLVEGLIGPDLWCYRRETAFSLRGTGTGRLDQSTPKTEDGGQLRMASTRNQIGEGP
jgi:hypothetical protein